MDRFKFRIWSEEEQRFWDWSSYNNQSKKYGNLLLMLGGDGLLYDVDHGIQLDKPPGRTKIEQCTGLKDKNGNLIYEGDIISHPSGCYGDSVAAPGVKVVIWDSCHNEAGFWIEDLPDDCPWCECEIIGNIHENPELLS